MKKLLIADDDFIVRTYLKQMLPWKEKGFLLTGGAKNGKEALNICQNERPDIIITDMSMPVMNGMELIKALKSKQETAGIGIIVLSCHDDFIYVKDAMKAGADDYILKNDLSPESLLDALNKIKIPEKTRSSANDEISAEELADIGRGKLLDDFFSSFSSPQIKDADILAALAEKAGIKEKFAACCCILVNLENRQEYLNKLEPEDVLSFNQAFAEMCRAVCKDNAAAAKQPPAHYVFHLPENKSRWCVLLDFGKESSVSAANRYLQTAAGKINAFALRYFNLKTVCYISSIQRSLAGLKQHWLRLHELTACSFYTDEGVIFESGGVLLKDHIPAIIAQMTDDLAQAVNYSSDETFAEKLKGFFAILSEEKIAPQTIRQIIYDLEIKLRSRLNIDWREIKNFAAFQKIFSAQINKLRTNKEIDHPAVRAALTWIDKHYKEPISQQEIAQHVHLNPAYFSSLFKKYMNVTFSDYIICYRLEKVKKQLTSSNEKIKDIAFNEGFADYQYFCKLFKRVVGMSPSEWRSENSQKSAFRM